MPAAEVILAAVMVDRIRGSRGKYIHAADGIPEALGGAVARWIKDEKGVLVGVHAQIFISLR
jgi:hypothetical protein